MGRKSKVSKEDKTQACIDYLSGKYSAIELAQKLKMSKYGMDVICNWSKQFQAFGEKAFEERPRNNLYSKEFKVMVIQKYLKGYGSLVDLSLKYSIPSKSTLQNWVLKYNKGKEILGYVPRPEVYTMARVKTTKEERLKIVKHCLDHQKDYKECAFSYGVSYAQVYDWVKRYLKDGEAGLNDNRGHKKSLEELTDAEKKDRELHLLKRKNLLLERENELLKKQRDLEAKLMNFQVTKK